LLVKAAVSLARAVDSSAIAPGERSRLPLGGSGLLMLAEQEPAAVCSSLLLVVCPGGFQARPGAFRRLLILFGRSRIVVEAAPGFGAQPPPFDLVP